MGIVQIKRPRSVLFLSFQIFCSCDLNHVFDPCRPLFNFQCSEKVHLTISADFPVTKSKLSLLATKQARESGVEVLRQGIATVFGKLDVCEDTGLKVWMPVFEQRRGRRK